ncbi:MAG: hypothetical protein DMF01_08035 [Verrucomicrobia bacterium]|nr:MAG: hypothetical protein DMF01_08035 [Verrucomicrobiota bacterium]
MARARTNRPRSFQPVSVTPVLDRCDECVRKLRPALRRISGVKDVRVDLKHERVIVTFDARKTHPPDLHDAILNSGYKPAPVAD